MNKKPNGKSGFKTVEEYLDSLPEDRRTALGAVREVVRKHLPQGYVECMQGAMIGYVVPHSLYPKGYHCDPRQPLQYAALTSGKSSMSLHMMAIYGDPEAQEWLQTSWKAAGKKLDMGKACIRFKKLDELPLEVVGQLIARLPARDYIERVEKFLQSRKR